MSVSITFCVVVLCTKLLYIALLSYILAMMNSQFLFIFHTASSDGLKSNDRFLLMLSFSIVADHSERLRMDASKDSSVYAL